MKTFKKLAIAGVLSAIGFSANAATLVFDFQGEVNDITIPHAYADLYEIWNSNPAFNDYRGTIVVENFEQYATGTHVLNIASANSPLQLSLYNGLLTGIEGQRIRGAAGGVFLPDDSQVGNAGALTITDGKVVSFSWNATGVDSPALATFNSRTLAGFPVQIYSIDVKVATPHASAYQTYAGGSIILTESYGGTASVVMVPEPETYAMLLSGLGLIGLAARRRMKV